MDYIKKIIAQRRFYVKAKMGIICHRGERLRIFVLTESNEAIDSGLAFITKFKHLIAYLRKRYGRFEYCCVLHRQGDKKRLNYHVMFYGSYIPQKVIQDWWFENYRSNLSKMSEVKLPMQQARYLSKYLSKEGGSEEFVDAHFSSWWVFPGWWQFSKWIKREFPGDLSVNNGYAPDNLFRDYHNKTERELWSDPFYSLWLGSKVRPGKKLPEHRFKKVSFYEKMLKSGELKIVSVEE